MGCKVKITPWGYLAYRLFWNGIESWEGTRLKNTPENLRLMKAKALIIEDEMKRGVFDYLRRFPTGNKAHLFAGRGSSTKTAREHYEEWIKEKIPPLVRKSLVRDYKQHFNGYILPRLGPLSVSELSAKDIKDLRIYLVQKRKLSIKTVRNVISGTLRAFVRDARADGVIRKDPFDDLPRRWWPHIEKPTPDPFTEEERDRILSHYRREKLPHQYRYLYFQFWEGTRPSEATALRWGRADLERGKAEIVVSRDLGEEAAPKTRASRRVIDLFPNVVQMLKIAKPAHAKATDYVFVNSRRRPVRQDSIRIKGWYTVLEKLEIRARKPSATRHTFISVMLSHGANPKWVAEHCGNSVQTIQEHYGKYILWRDDAPLRAILASQKSERSSERFSDENRKAANVQRKRKWSQRDSNPCYRRERPVS